jgi:hypothetical protein
VGRRINENLYERELAAAQALPTTKVAAPGVFVSYPNATFDRVAIVHYGVTEPGPAPSLIAQDRKTGSIHGWTLHADPTQPPLSLPEGMTLLSGFGSTGHPLISNGREIYFLNGHNFEARLTNLNSSNWTKTRVSETGIRSGFSMREKFVGLENSGQGVVVYDHQRKQLSQGSIEKLIPGVKRVECMTHQLYPNSMMGAQTAESFIFIGLTEDRGRRLFVVRSVEEPWQFEDLPFPSDSVNDNDEVTACAASKRALYLSLRGGGIHQIAISNSSIGYGLVAKHVGSLDRKMWNDFPIFSGLAVGVVRRDSYKEALYAAAGNGSIYRFSLDLQPDQRIDPILSTK